MTSLNRHDAGQLLDFALRLRLAGHSIGDVDIKRRFVRRAQTFEKRALALLHADSRFQASLPQEIRPA